MNFAVIQFYPYHLHGSMQGCVFPPLMQVINQEAFAMHVVNEEVGLEDEEEKVNNEFKTSIRSLTNCKHLRTTSGNNSVQQPHCVKDNASQIIHTTSEGGETKSHQSQQRVLGVRIVTPSNGMEGFRNGVWNSMARLRDIKFYNSII